jgi:hypothetical protein
LSAVTEIITEPPTTTVTEKQYDSTMLFTCVDCIKLVIYNDYLISTLTNTKVSDFTSLEKQYYTVFRLYLKDFVRTYLLKLFNI